MLHLSHISKRFGATVALADVSFDVRAGEVHALLGENGAGKSTLMQIAAGLLAPDSGARQADGRVALVHQHFTAIPALTVGENIALAAGWRETGRRAERRAADVIARLALPLDPAARVESLSVQLRQRLEIVKALATDAQVLLLDEPTAVLAPREVTELLTLVRGIAARGGAVVLISHKLREVLEVADRITVLRRGVVTHSGPRAGETAGSLSEAMIGGGAIGDWRLVIGEQPQETENVSRRMGTTRVTLGDSWFAASNRQSPIANREQPAASLRAGQVVCIAAIEGNGQRALLRGIAGVEPAEGITVHGTVAFIPEDRTTEALIGEFTLAENLVLGTPDAARRWIDWGAVQARTAELLAAYDVRAPGPTTLAGTLSGGNQQKFVFARVLSGHPDVIVAEDPTRGLDVAATAAIHARLRAAADAGACVIVHSSDLDEVLLLADRLLVMANGALTELPRDTPREAVGDAMLGITPAAPA